MAKLLIGLLVLMMTGCGLLITDESGDSSSASEEAKSDKPPETSPSPTPSAVATQLPHQLGFLGGTKVIANDDNYEKAKKSCEESEHGEKGSVIGKLYYVGNAEWSKRWVLCDWNGIDGAPVFSPLVLNGTNEEDIKSLAFGYALVKKGDIFHSIIVFKGKGTIAPFGDVHNYRVIYASPKSNDPKSAKYRYTDSRIEYSGSDEDRKKTFDETVCKDEDLPCVYLPDVLNKPIDAKIMLSEDLELPLKLRRVISE